VRWYVEGACDLLADTCQKALRDLETQTHRRQFSILLKVNSWCPCSYVVQRPNHASESVELIKAQNQTQAKRDDNTFLYLFMVYSVDTFTYACALI